MFFFLFICNVLLYNNYNHFQKTLLSPTCNHTVASMQFRLDDRHEISFQTMWSRRRHIFSAAEFLRAEDLFAIEVQVITFELVLASASSRSVTTAIFWKESSWRLKLSFAADLKTLSNWSTLITAISIPTRNRGGLGWNNFTAGSVPAATAETAA